MKYHLLGHKSIESGFLGVLFLEEIAACAHIQCVAKKGPTSFVSHCMYVKRSCKIVLFLAVLV